MTKTLFLMVLVVTMLVFHRHAQAEPSRLGLPGLTLVADQRDDNWDTWVDPAAAFDSFNDSFHDRKPIEHRTYAASLNALVLPWRGTIFGSGRGMTMFGSDGLRGKSARGWHVGYRLGTSLLSWSFAQVEHRIVMQLDGAFGLHDGLVAGNAVMLAWQIR